MSLSGSLMYSKPNGTGSGIVQTLLGFTSLAKPLQVTPIFEWYLSATLQSSHLSLHPLNFRHPNVFFI